MSKKASLGTISDYVITNKEYHFDKPPFNDPEVKAKLVSLLPPRLDQKVRFIIGDVDTSVANAIRRVILSELKVKSLTFDLAELVTNDREIIIADLVDRIALLPLDQDVEEDAVFSFELRSTTASSEYKVGYSKDIIQIAGKKLKQRPFDDTFRLLEIRPNSHIKIPRIHVASGYCYEDNGARFSLTSEFKFQVRDYFGVDVLNDRGNLINKMVSREEMRVVAASQKIKLPEQTCAIYNPKILVIPDPAYQELLDQRTKDRLKDYSLIIELRKNDVLNYPSSSEISPREYFMEFTTYNIHPQKLLHMACDNIIERLTKLLDRNAIDIKTDENKTQIMLQNEDHTIPRMLVRTIFELDPEIALINTSQVHVRIRASIITIKHPNPLDIFDAAVKRLVGIFQNLKTQFKV
jgi:DNA-directed RNA polymerase subunit L